MPRRHSWRQNLKDLAELTETLISASDPSQLYEQLTERIAQMVGARICLIATYDKATKTFTAQKSHYGSQALKNLSLSYQVTPEQEALWNFRKNGALLSNNPSADPRILSAFVKGYSAKSVILAPMIVRNEMLGLIAIINKRGGFTEFDSYLTSTIAYQAGFILTNSRLMNEEKRRSEQIQFLNETARQLNASLVQDDILKYAISGIQKALRMNEVAVYVPAENDSILEMRACSGPYQKQIKEQGYIQSSAIGFLGHAFRNAITVFSNDCKSHPLFLAHPLIPTNSEVCIPVKRENRVLAVLNVESSDRDAFTPDDILTLETLADQLAVAFSNAVIYEGERKHNNQMLLLSELISELASILDREKIVKTTVERIKQRFQYYFVAMGWVHEEEQVIHNWYFVPRFEALSRVISRVPIAKGLTGAAVRTGKTVLVPDTSKAEDYYNLLEEVRSELAVPVKIGDTVVAVLDLESDRLGAFDDSDVLIMETLAHALSTALQNADSYHRLERTNSQLADTVQQKDEIVQIVAHDFRSPLTVIRGYMDYLLKRGEWKDERQKEIMETVSSQAQRLQKLAEATLKASRLDSGDIAFSYEKVDFRSFLQRLIFPWSEKHKFVVHADDDLPLIRADAGRLQEVMENLLSNAIKYSPNGGAIEITAGKAKRSELPEGLMPENGDNFLLVSVSDEGIGIPPDKKNMLFQRFSRVHDNRRIEGIGLGLYIAKRMIETHGGRIWLGEKEKGTQFCFAIPTIDEQSSRDNILIVDDDIHTLRLLHKALSEIGFDVVTAADGKEALDKLYRFKPHLMILDVLMPGLGGPELIARLKANPETASIPLVVFTGKADFHLAQEFGEIPVISKNAGIQRLKDVVEQTLRGKREPQMNTDGHG